MMRFGERVQPMPDGVPNSMIVPFSIVVPWLRKEMAFFVLKIMSLCCADQHISSLDD